VSIDWPGLRTAAVAAAARAYAPYSGLRVGAAGQAADGRLVTGCNVENASYGMTLCAECGLVSALHATGARHATGAEDGPAAGAEDGPADGAEDGPADGSGAGAVPRLVAVAVVAGDGAPLLPCGRCRQLLLEAGGPGLLVDTDGGPVELDALLPAAFTGTDLAQRRDPQREDPQPGESR
jgi:cytidine deaminase